MRPWVRGQDGVVEIGNAQGKIAVYLDETEAIEMAEQFGKDDMFRKELMEAVEIAYPQEEQP